MIKRITALALAVGALGFTATADAAVSAGVFKGKTEQGAAVSLKVLSSKKAIVKFSWEGAVLGCSDGNNRQLAGFTSPSSVKVPLSRTGKFRFTAGPDDGSLEFVTIGKIKGKRAAGALQVQARINEDGSIDPAGSITCDSEPVGWTARKR
jgi:hypothetical protein